MDPYGVLELTRKLGREPNVDTALNIMQWELGDLVKDNVHSQWHPDLARVYKAEAKKAIADLLFQLHVVMVLLELVPGEVLEMGIKVVEERIVDKEKKLGRFEHYVGDKKDA